MWDLFICYASEDKNIAKPIYDALYYHLWVWYDDAIFTIGDSISRTIDTGLKNSKMGLIILSEKFFEKTWPERELHALQAKEERGIYRILPIWYNINREFIVGKSPILADIKAININNIDELKIEKIIDAVNSSGIPSTPISYIIKKEEIPAIQMNTGDFISTDWNKESTKAVDNYIQNTDWQTQDIFINDKNHLKLGILVHRYPTIDEAKAGFLMNKKKYESQFGKLFKLNVGEESYGYVSGYLVEVVTFRTTNILATVCYYFTKNRSSITYADKFARTIDRKIRTLISKKIL